MKKVISLISYLALALSLAGLLSANQTDPYYVKVPQLEEPPKIDGQLDNPIWEKGVILDKFTQYEPEEGASPSEKTIVYLGYDRHNLYIAVRCYDSHPQAIRASLTKRDEVRGDDIISIYLDTFNDKKRAFVFQVNPRGVQVDGIYTETRRRGRGMMGFDRVDRNWDTFFLSAGTIDDEGYVVELAIPFKSLRFPNRRPQVWGFQVMRQIRRKSEEIYWHPRSRDVNGFLIQTGTIEIPGDIDRGKNLEIMPVMTGLKKNDSQFDPDFGLNLKYGLTSDLTLDLTYNPDFSQVEADMPQIDVNQRYALYYPEKRPFFLEGKDLYDTPFELIYTRTISNPKWGLKLSGKLGKTTVGLLSTLDETPSPIQYDDYSTDDYPLSSTRAWINVFRLKQDIYTESHLGFILTDKEMGSGWNNLSQHYNRILGVDGHFKIKRYNRLAFQIVGSQTKIGENKTDWTPATMLNFSHASRHISFTFDFYRIPEEFEAATGFFRRKDIQAFNSRFSYAFLPMNKWIISIRPSLSYRRIYDFNNILTDEQYSLSLFINGWRQSHIWANFESSLERYGGINFHKKNMRVSFASEPFAWLSGNIMFSFGDGIYYDTSSPYLGYKTSRSLRLTLRPLSNLRMFYTYRNDNFYRQRGGEEVYSVNIISQRITYQLSRTLSLRLITDYNDYYQELYASLLFSYELRPGTVFYLGFDDNLTRDPGGLFQTKGRYYFIKFSYWWRI